MTGAAEVDKPMSASEIASLNAVLADRLRKDRISVRPAKPPAAPPRRRPLGLAPAPGASDDLVHEAQLAGDTGDGEYQNATIALVSQSSELVIGLIEDVRRHFANKLASLENAHAKLVNENTALRLILENLRVTQRGERGVDGDRGAPGAAGRDGLQGPVGPRGEQGPRGHDAPRIVAWEINDTEFVAYPLLSTGHKGPGLHLRGMFEVYDGASDEADAAEQADAYAAAR
jgi:hypothetical protein